MSSKYTLYCSREITMIIFPIFRTSILLSTSSKLSLVCDSPSNSPFFSWFNFSHIRFLCSLRLGHIHWRGWWNGSSSMASRLGSIFSSDTTHLYSLLRPYSLHSRFISSCAGSGESIHFEQHQRNDTTRCEGGNWKKFKYYSALNFSCFVTGKLARRCALNSSSRQSKGKKRDWLSGVNATRPNSVPGP